ncbi:MAG TPA: hypothetical protein VF692_04450 [Pyrinomonadaceae bacterium]|jgi:hypothetical protein
MLNEENLISTLEQSLRQTRNAQNRLLARLREVEGEAEVLRTEIDALQNSAEKTEEAIDSLFSTMRTGNKTWKTNKKPYYADEDAYELPPEPRRYTRNMPPVNQNNQPNHNAQQNNNNQQNYNPRENHNLRENHNIPSNGNYRNNSVSYLNNARNMPSANPNIEPMSNRFVDRTITQACTLLLKEANYPLHVNELYNLLCAGGMEFKGNNPTISIAVSLNRNRRFRKVAPGTFDLVMRDASHAASK